MPTGIQPRLRWQKYMGLLLDQHSIHARPSQLHCSAAAAASANGCSTPPQQLPIIAERPALQPLCCAAGLCDSDMAVAGAGAMALVAATAVARTACNLAPHADVPLLLSLPLPPLPLLVPGAASECSWVGSYSSGTGRCTLTSSSATCATTTVMSSILPPCRHYSQPSSAVHRPNVSKGEAARADCVQRAMSLWPATP